jgi:hypothetical protein
MRRRAVPLLAGAVLLAGCAAPPLTPTPGGAPPSPGAATMPSVPWLGFFSRIRVPDGHEPTLQLAAKGVQIFRCERDGTGYGWRFRLPEAELYDTQGRAVGRHGANFSFEHRDGSRLLGTVVAHDKASADDALPWLLLSAKSYAGGEFAGVSYVQRVNTRGGMPPRACDASQQNRLLRVDFSADFVFYRPRG